MTSVNQEPTPSLPASSEVITSPDASADLLASSLGDYLRIVSRRLRSGESGALPVIVGLIVIVIIFQVKNSLFLSAGNLVNLMAQSAFIITLGMAEIFVLLLGDIDLAAGFTAACGAVVALWMLALGDPWWAAVLVALAVTAAYGALQGIVIAKLGLPSFVVTLAGQLGLSGLLLYLINLTDVFRVADRLAVLYLGRMVSSGPAADYDTSSAVHWMTTGTAPGGHAAILQTAVPQGGGTEL